MANTGKWGGKCKNFKDFHSEEIIAHLGLYLLHGISPAPQIEIKFQSSFDDPVNGSDLCSQVFERVGVTRYKEFKTFFACVSPFQITPPTTSHPNFKLNPLLKHMMRVSKEAIRIGQSISIDEMGIEGRVTHITKRMVELRYIRSRKLCKRAWWNVEKIEENANPQ